MSAIMRQTPSKGFREPNNFVLKLLYQMVTSQIFDAVITAVILANIGVMARKREYFPWIAAALTEAYVASRFAHFMARPEMDRYALPGLPALNFVLHHALGGGGVASLRNDPQAKGYAQILLDTPVIIPAQLLED